MNDRTRTPTATGSPAGRVPAAAPGLRVSPFATGLDHPRWITVLPGVAIDRRGDLRIADDVGDTIWRVSAA